MRGFLWNRSSVDRLWMTQERSSSTVSSPFLLTWEQVTIGRCVYTRDHSNLEKGTSIETICSSVGSFMDEPEETKK